MKNKFAAASHDNGQGTAGIIIVIGLILVIVSSVFLPSLTNDFVNWDDDRYIGENIFIKDFSFKNLKNIFTKFYMGNYHPVTMLSYSLNYHFFRLEPSGYHATNLILHLSNCIFAFWLIFLLSGKISVAFVTSLVFGIHPLQADSVSWISERKGLLYTAFFLSALISYIYYMRKNKRAGYYYLSLFLFSLSLLSKPMAVTFPLVLLALDYLYIRGQKTGWGKNIFLEKIPFFVLAAIMLIISVFSQRLDGAIRAEGLGWLDKIMIASYCIVFYLNKIFFPVRLSCLYPYPQRFGFLPPIFLATTIIFVLLVILVLSSRRHLKSIVFCFALFLITISPALQFVPIGASMVANRYVYLPLLWVVYAFAEGFFLLYTKQNKYMGLVRVLLLTVLIAVIGVLSISARNRTKVWKDSLSLWSDCINNYPHLVTAYNSRGTIFLKKGEYDRAYDDFRQAIITGYNEFHMIEGTAYYSMDLQFAIINLANVYNAVGRKEDAITTLKEAIALNSNYEGAYFNLGNIYYSLGEDDKAIGLYKKAIEINPTFAAAHNNLALAYYRLKMHALAIRHCDEAIKLGFKVEPEFLEWLKPYR